MAKTKIFELAKELGIQSRDIITFLQKEGVEAKAAQSSIEDEAVRKVRKHFGKSEGEKRIVTEGEMRMGDMPEKKEVQKEAQGAKDQAPVKKKKNIIFVSNPHNSKMQSQKGQQGGRPAGGSARPASGKEGAGRQGASQSGSRNGARSGAGQRSGGKILVGQPKLIRPLTKPSQPQMPDERLEEQKRRREAEERAAREQKARQEREAAEKAAREQEAAQKAAASAGTDRGAENEKGQRTQSAGSENRQSGNRQPERHTQGARSGREERGGRDGRDSRDGRGGQNARGPRSADGQNRPGSGSRPGGSQRSAQGRDGRPGGARPGANGERPNGERGQGAGGRQDNRSRRPAPGKGFAAEAPVKENEKRREEEKRRNSQERDRRSKKEHIYEEDESKSRLKNRPGRFIKPEPVKAEPEEQIKVITLPENITIKDLADKMKVQAAGIIKKLFMEGKIVTLNQEISYEEAESIAIEYDIICEKEVKVDVIEELLKEDEEKEEDMVPRPPVICVMGHVDHGKTSLLDAIRKTNVTDKEAGGITQHIGAYTVQINGQTITFLDTPGHEAFTAMRMRGANATDIAVLVVAADDGVMPQTVEAISHARAAGIEIIVAVNKIDKPNANIDRVKQELAEYELIPEEWGGSTVFAPVSAKTGEGISQLLEMILLTAEILELKANPNRMARGLVIEAQLDKGRGPVATVLVQKGTLHVGDFISAGASHGKVRAMIDDKGRRVKEAAK